MFPKSLIAAAALALLANPALAQQGPNFDANSDGKVDVTEYVTVNSARMMERLDADKDGKITAAERAAAQAARGGGGGGGGGGGMRGMGNADADGDGVITAAEVKASSEARFKTLDANADGNLTTEERQAGRTPRPAA